MREYWFKLSDKIRFLIIGGFNAGVSYLIYSAFCLVMGDSAYQIALALAWAISSVVSYTTQKFLVFQANGNWIKEYLKCCSTWAVSYLLNVIILELLVRFAIKNVYLSQFISIFLVSVVTYVLFKYFAFKTHKK